jgi:hypothetical protein
MVHTGWPPGRTPLCHRPPASRPINPAGRPRSLMVFMRSPHASDALPARWFTVLAVVAHCELEQASAQAP